MHLLLRLIIAGAFALWALPKVAELMGGPDSLNPERLLQKHEAISNQASQKLDTDAKHLMASLDDLSIYDDGLKRCIGRELQRMYGGNLKHARELDNLLCDRMNIRNLDGIDMLSNLKSMSLRGNRITSVAVLADLPKLRAVDLSGNPEIHDFTSLSYANNLQQVSITNLSGTYCHEVESVFEQIQNNKTGWGGSGSTKELMRGVQCRGKKTRGIETLQAKRDRGEQLTIDETRRLRDYESDQRWN